MHSYCLDETNASAHTGDPNFATFAKNIFFHFHFCRFWRATAAATAAAAEEFLARSRPGIPSHPGIKYPVRQSPHFDLETYVATADLD